MKKIILILAVTLLFIWGCSASDKAQVSQTDQHEHAEGYYTCPMHPTIVQDEPGDCPICGMDLVWQSNSEADTSEENSNDSNVLTIDPVVVQNMGVRIEHADRRDIVRNIRTVGKVQLADDKSYSINLKYSGWIEEIYADEIGREIKKGDPLFQIYSPELISAQEEYLNTVKTFGKESDLAISTKRRLNLWDLSDKYLDTLIKENNAQKNPVISSPFAGFILHKTMQQGSFVKAGKDLYHLGNLDEIWIMADVYEFDIPFLKVNSKVEIDIANFYGKKLHGKIDYIYPTLNEKTRTQTIRIELDNFGHQMKPGMFATLNINSEVLLDVLTIPTESIINSGNRKIVFISLGDGRYEAREIEIGVSDDLEYYTQVVSGLQEGEIVVTSGQFLLDSESQLREAVQKLLDAKLETPAGSSHDHSQSESFYYTCPMHPTIVQHEPGDCPICGMDLVKKEK
ncbi:MAG: efflux RND transporter periplasmic adaptor subunit [Candidatus Cloacimonetes bacterium]|nr:efflux RND transporter periplasmic adaptor subunit [Candidatus Cloacimonadota bacterium]MCF7813150.1 efflux RND transporter periplasmic adaptor subunit [Candidatus Cloacimonadota bacterium]MCF7867598.1 efflux RND transporter periplasmic adaptor subunit [Candidatus Cloacimonadota bacterium]MCF7883127.1 efflux RND transporter periplasmic adaptor subunit [Candidatus Cloacimonadota bacterium]